MRGELGEDPESLLRRVCKGPLCDGRKDAVPLIDEEVCRACAIKGREMALDGIAARIEGGQPYVLAKVRQAIRLQAEGHALITEAMKLLDQALRAVQ